MLRIENLNVDYYRRGRVIPAVREFSLTIGAGETLGLVGESGSGKSTVALSVLRLFRPQEGRITSGSITFHGDPLLSYSEEQMRKIRGNRISMIFQDPFTALNPVMTVREQLQEGLDAHADTLGAGLVPARIGLRAGTRPAPTVLHDALARVQLDPKRVLDAYPHQLSGGQRQRVMIAMALLNEPELILADEPTTALDVLVQKDILDLLFDLQKNLKMSMLLISHNLALVAQYTPRIAVMKEGRLVEEGESRALFHAPKHPYTRQLVAALPHFSKWTES